MKFCGYRKLFERCACWAHNFLYFLSCTTERLISGRLVGFLEGDVPSITGTAQWLGLVHSFGASWLDWYEHGLTSRPRESDDL